MECEDIVLVTLATIIVVGYGYSMDMPQALELPLRGAPYNLDSVDFNLLYFATYLPVMITDIPLGIVLDKFPLQKTVIAIALTSFLAELGTAVLFDLRPEGYLWMVYLLRAVVGMAGSSAFTMQGFILTRYAAEHYELLAGFGLCVPFVFDAINVTITPLIYDATQSISLPWYIASGVDFLAVLAALWIAIIVSRKQRRKEAQKEKRLLQSGREDDEESEQQQQFKVSYLWQMPKLFWLINLAIFANQAVIGIYSNLNDLIVNRFRIDYVTTGQLLIVPYVLGSIVALIFGRLIITKPTTRRLTILFVSSCMTLGFLILGFLPNNKTEDEVDVLDYLIVILFLVLFSLLTGMLYTVLASSVSLLADKKRLGTAWGVIGTAIGLGESISPIANGLIEDDADLPNSYQTLTFTYAAMSSVAVILGLVIFWGPFEVIDSSFNATHTLKEEQVSKEKEQRRQLRKQTRAEERASGVSLLTQ